MYQKLRMIMATMALLGLTAGSAVATTISVLPADTTVTDTAVPVDITIQGNFDVATIGGSLSLSWDASVLSLIGGIPAGVVNPVCTVCGQPTWNLFTVTDTSAGTTGSFDLQTGLLFSSVGPGLVDIATLSFNYIGDVGTSATILVEPVGNGWSDFNGAVIPIDPTTGYIDATVTRPVPVPAAVWLMMSGILGLIGVARRRTSA